MPYALKPVPPVLYRVGRLPDPFMWRPPFTGPLKEDDRLEAATEGGRFDDALGQFATLYLAPDPVVAVAETIQDFRPRPGLIEAIQAATDHEDPDPEFDVELVSGVLPREFFEPPAPDPTNDVLRALGVCQSTEEQQLVDLSEPATHVELNAELAAAVAHLGIDRFDRGVMMSQDRRITRRVASHLHDRLAGEAVGILYESRFIDGPCVALWEPARLASFDTRPVSHDGALVREAADLLGIRIGP